jgi:hypothetical protein
MFVALCSNPQKPSAKDAYRGSVVAGLSQSQYRNQNLLNDCLVLQSVSNYRRVFVDVIKNQILIPDKLALTWYHVYNSLLILAWARAPPGELWDGGAEIKWEKV